jgi:general secretion pathway protein F
MIFEYQAFDKSGKKHNNTISADSIKDARKNLKTQDLQVINIKEVKEKSNKSLFESKLSVGDIVSFTRQLASLISASVPIDESLKTIMQDNDNAKLNKIVSRIYAGVIGGMPLHQAMGETSAFDEYFIASIKSGEKGSNLIVVLERLSIEVEKQYEFKKKISSATTYPIVISIVAFVVIFAMLTFVVPQITQVFAQNNQELPPITIAVIVLSDFVREYKSAILMFIVLSFIGFKILFRYDSIKLIWQKFLAKIPIIGRLMIIANATRFARTLSILHTSNTPMVEALKHSYEVLKFLPMKNAVQKATTKVKEGSSVYMALKTENAMPNMMLYMIASGEKSSSLSQMLDKAADSGEYELDNSTKKIISTFEPIMILIMGGIVLLIVMAILLPIFEMNNAVI